MAYAFNEDKGKVDIDAILNGLQTNYQNNVNTIYNAIVNNGVTPTAKTPTACATGINNIRSGGNATAAQILATRTAIVNKQTVTGSMANYSGSNRRTVTPSGGTGNEQISLSAGYHDSVIVNRTAPYNAGYSAAQAITWTETIKLSERSDSSTLLSCWVTLPIKNLVKVKNTSGFSITLYRYYSGGSEAINLNNNVEYSIPNNTTKIEFALSKNVTVPENLDGSLLATFQAKVLR